MHTVHTYRIIEVIHVEDLQYQEIYIYMYV